MDGTILPHGPMPSICGEPPAWSPVRYRGISPRPTALRIVVGMAAPVLRRLGACHPINQSLAGIATRWEATVFDLRLAADAVRSGETHRGRPLQWSQRNADVLLARLRTMRRQHSAAVKMARELAALPQVVAS